MNQRMKALSKGNEVRMVRAALKRSLAAGETSIAEVLSDVPPCAKTMKVEDLLRACPGIGKTRAHKIIAHMEIYGVYHTTQLGWLSERHSSILLSTFRDFYPICWEHTNEGKG